MSNYLFAVDVQREFVQGSNGLRVYNKCIDFINNAKAMGYDKVIALYYHYDENFNNMKRLKGWTPTEESSRLEFSFDDILFHSSYSADIYYDVGKNDRVDIIGFDTDACVLSTAFDIFNRDCNMRVLANLCWSSGGRDMHYAALQIMQRQFGNGLDMFTDVG